MVAKKLKNVVEVSPTEDQIQIAVASWLDKKGLLWCHVANERRTSPRKGAILKRKGVKRGVPDILIFSKPLNYPLFHSVALELKRNKQCRASLEQLQWLTNLKLNGWFTGIVYGYNDAIQFLKACGY